MKDCENNCYKFILNLAKKLAQEYDVQYQHITIDYSKPYIEFYPEF